MARWSRRKPAGVRKEESDKRAKSSGLNGWGKAGVGSPRFYED